MFLNVHRYSLGSLPCGTAVRAREGSARRRACWPGSAVMRAECVKRGVDATIVHKQYRRRQVLRNLPGPAGADCPVQVTREGAGELNFLF